MKTANDLPLSRLHKQKRVMGSLLTCLIILGVVVSYFPSYEEIHKEKEYKSEKLVLSTNKIEEYKEEMYDPYALRNKAYGTIKKMFVARDAKKDGNHAGTKRTNEGSEHLLLMENSPSAPPVISLNKGEVTIYEGTDYNVSHNIASVTDETGEAIPYVEAGSQQEDIRNYFTIVTDLNRSVLGDYPVIIKATDQSGYSAEARFIVHVVKKPVVVKSAPTYSNPAPRVSSGSLTDIAYSLVGSRYVAGGSSPSGFDCSGFVSYVYSQIGVSISRSTSGQYSTGTSVGRENMMPGDILVWSANGSYPTHTALYVGGGVMIHAANPRKGVIISNVSTWPETLLSVRRV